MEAVRQKIQNILTKQPESVIDAVVEKLEADGVSGVDDLEYVTASDLTGLLKPIEVRKLLKSWISDEHAGLRNIEQFPDCSVEPSTSRHQIETSAPAIGIVSPPSSRNDPSWPYKFNVPWNKLPVALLRRLEKGERLVPRERKQLIHVIIDEVLVICERPTSSQLAVIAQKVYKEFPNAITDCLTGTTIGSGFGVFAKQLRNRAENQNRKEFSDNPLRLQRPQNENAIEAKTQKLQKERDSYGCINWQPEVHANEREELLRTKAEMQAPRQNESEFNVNASLKMTYPLQREEINNGKGVRELKMDWPLLFTESGLLFHFQELTGHDGKAKMTAAYQQKASRVVAYAKHGNKNQKVNKASAEIFKNLDAAKAVCSDNHPYLLAVFQLIMISLEEDITQLFYTVGEHILDTEVDMANCAENPCLVLHGDSPLLARRFTLVVDKTVILTNITSVISALSLLFAAFYCFNIEYPNEASATLEFIQRCFIGIDPDKGTKAGHAKKKKTPRNPKVLALFSALADFEWAQVGLD